jgi:(2,2,3-trimethyl-5-oxocyclopent-3-enyl)acetyl-CoA 1,5-monooxygenase
MMDTHVNEAFDAVVIGAGVTGLYQVYSLLEAGISVRGIEAGADVGGTWYWNRYPGCRLDTESYAYGYFQLKGILPDWQWKERFASQPELLAYARAAADEMGVRPHYRFNTKVRSATYDEPSNCWNVLLDDDSTIACRYLISAVGPLSATRMPDIPGIESFEGQSFHSSRWPRPEESGGQSEVDFSGKRVGVIGTGATGVQIIPIVAKSAARLHVFQRTPNWCTPLGNHALTEDLTRKLMGEPDKFLEFIKSTETAFPYQRNSQKGTEATAEERQTLFESLYDMPGYGIWLSGYRDLLTNKESNQYLGDFVASKIRQRVKDPVTAEKLIPRNHAFGTRRVPMETNYYEVYNQENVELVDIHETPIDRIVPEGIVVNGRLIELDVLIYATGFDAVTGALDRIDIRGRAGVSLKDAWMEGPATYLGLQTTGFPNFFTLVGAHNGAAFCNIGVCGALQVEWVTEMLEWMRQRALTCAEPVQAYQDEWTRQVYDIYSKTLLAESDAWWVKTTCNADGSITRRALIYVGGAPEYRTRCAEIAAKGYEGFSLR